MFEVLDALAEVREQGLILFVGPLGSGKTTLVRLLTRQYDGYEGRIEIDGTEFVMFTENLPDANGEQIGWGWTPSPATGPSAGSPGVRSPSPPAAR